MKRWWPFRMLWLVLIWGVSILLAGCQSPANSAMPITPLPEGGLFFPTTGHTVNPPFADLYQTLPNATEVLGYPITEAIPRPNGVLRQYFQNAVMETTPQGQPGFLALGEIFYATDQERAQPVSTESAGCREVVAGRPVVCHLFLRFYTTHEGANLLGEPISPLLLVDGRLVQYFRHVRLEFHPEADGEAQVRVSPLGERFFRVEGEDMALLQPPTTNLAPALSTPSPLQVQAHAPSRTIAAQGQSIIYITVSDAQGRPVANAEVNLEIQARTQNERWRTITTNPITLGTTNEQGVLVWTFRPTLYQLPVGTTWVRCRFTVRNAERPLGETYLDLQLWPPP